ncbi:MAG: type II methionyl aminopeptidase [Thermoproteota archaeon]|nr:type II methionyl aminopeptidase [Thermoproteota archaeon]
MDLLECYQRAGKIASEQREKSRRKDHVGSTLLEICEFIERDIEDKGGMPAFPVNVSLNDVAAHYTAEPHDETTVRENDILKIDIGVQVEGYIADTAVTVSYDPDKAALIRSAESALSEAVRIARADTKASEIGKHIEDTISRSGFKPIQNLSGHSLAQYTIHAGKSIPNIWTVGPSFVLSSGHAYAIEPFVTMKDGQGVVYEGNIRNIFAITSRKPTKIKEADIFLAYLWAKFRTLPFALRWILHDHDEGEARRLLDILTKKRNIHSYPVLVEGKNKVVAQAEHTIIPFSSSTHVLTL